MEWYPLYYRKNNKNNLNINLTQSIKEISKLNNKIHLSNKNNLNLSTENNNIKKNNNNLFKNQINNSIINL